MADTSNLTQFLTDVANAIKEKTGKTDKIPAANFDTAIKAIQAGTDTSDATATAESILKDKIAYGKDGRIVGTLEVGLTKDEYNTCLNISNQILNSDNKPYTELDYIQSSGTQYIDTGYIPNNNTKVELVFEDLAFGVGYDRLFGVAAEFEIFKDNFDPKYYGRVNGHDGPTFPISPSTKYKITMGQGKVMKDDTVVWSYTDSFSTDKNLYLFWANCADRYGVYKLYSCKIYDGNVLIRDYIPIKDADNVICLFDKVSYKFVYNAGTGTFIGGEK